jgi:hypothetical protein
VPRRYRAAEYQLTGDDRQIHSEAPGIELAVAKSGGGDRAMTTTQKVLWTFGAILVAGLGILFVILMAGDSPILVKGGSITFHADSGWTRTDSNPICASAALDTCKYTSANNTNTSQLRVRGVVGGDPALPNVVNWSITAYESVDASYTPSAVGVLISPSNQSGNPAGAGPRGYVSIAPTSGGGFYSNPASDKNFHHDPGDPNCHPGQQGHHCEELALVDVTINGQLSHYRCKASSGCRIDIGPKKLF